jgi:hypothetical protein
MLKPQIFGNAVTLPFIFLAYYEYNFPFLGFKFRSYSKTFCFVSISKGNVAFYFIVAVCDRKTKQKRQYFIALYVKKNETLLVFS